MPGNILEDKDEIAEKVIDKITVMRLWLDKLERHHTKLNNERENLIDRLYVDAMKQARTFIENRGWDETINYMSNWAEKAAGTNMMGPHHLRNVYLMVVDKMRSLEKKSKPELCKEYERFLK